MYIAFGKTYYLEFLKDPFLGPLLFNLDFSNLFLIMNDEDIASYGDDNTPYVSGRDIDEIIRFLEESLLVIIQMVCDNHFQENVSKCQVLLNTNQHVQVNTGAIQIEKSSSKKLFGLE